MEIAGESIQRIVEIARKHSRIAIIGFPGSGMRILSDELESLPDFEGYEFIHSEEFYFSTAEMQLIALIGVLGSSPKYIMDGCLGFRFLRKCEELNLTAVRPTCIIFVTSNIILEKHTPYVKGLCKIWLDFKILAERNNTQYTYLEWG